MPRQKKKPSNHTSGMYRYQATIGTNFDGSRIRKSFYSSKSADDAKMKALDYLNNLESRIITSDSKFSDVAKSYLESVKESLAPKTYQDYTTILTNHLIKYFGERKISYIKPHDVQAYFNKISSESPVSSMRKYKAVLNLVFKYAEYNEYIIKNPVVNIKLKSKIKETKKRVYSQQEAEAILKFAESYSNKSTATAIILMLAYGLRKGEALALHQDDVDVENKTITINHSVGDIKDKNSGIVKITLQPPKNDSSHRTIPVSDSLIDRIKSRSGYIIPNKNGGLYSPNNWTKRQYKKFMIDMQEKLNLEILTPHELRHTRATIWVNSGKNLFIVASMLGHSDLKMLQERYAHKDIESIRKQLEI